MDEDKIKKVDPPKKKRKQFDAPKTNAKDVNSKLPLELISPNVFTSLGKAIQYGIDKYGRDREGDYIYGSVDQFNGALLRHYTEWQAGEPFDESGLHHAEHMLWNMMAIIDLLYKSGEINKPEEVLLHGGRE